MPRERRTAAGIDDVKRSRSRQPAAPEAMLHDIRAHQEELWFQAEQLLDAQADFESSNRQLREWFDRAPVAYLMLDRSGMVEDSNATAAEWLGIDRDISPRHSFVAFVAAPDRQRFLDHMRFCRAGRPHVFSELSLQSRTGQQRPVHLTSRPAPERAGRTASFWTVAVDVTELRIAQELASRAQEQMERTARLASIGTLAAGVAHEINNPLNSIRMLAEYALSLGVKDDTHETFSEIIRQTQRCAGIVRGILRFSKNEPMPFALENLSEVVQHSASQAQASLVASPVTIELRLAGDLPPIPMCAMGLEQVLSNLLRNAVDAAGGAPVKITVTTRQTHHGQQIIVQDNGPGIPEEDLPHIFDPFYTTHQSSGGTGLGLSISHRIVSEHGGAISAANMPGGGAKFVIDLPAATKRELPSRPPE